MVSPEMSIFHFAIDDIIVTSGHQGVKLSGFEDTTKANGILTFFTGSHEGSVHSASESGLEEAFISYFGNPWSNDNKIKLERVYGNASATTSLSNLVTCDSVGEPAPHMDTTFFYTYDDIFGYVFRSN